MSSDETATRLSSKLLQGWCMMDKSCDVCFTPLMRDKEKNDYCCGCQVYINKRIPEVIPEKPKDPIPLLSHHSSLTTEKLEACIQLYADKLLVAKDTVDALNITEIIEKLAAAYKNIS